MAFYEFSPEELAKIFAYGNNEPLDSPLSVDLIKRFLGFAAAVQNRSVTDFSRAVAALRERDREIERLSIRCGEMDKAGDFADLEFDSVELAKVIMYTLNEKRIGYSMRTVNYLLYEAYASWLCRYRERLTKEAPVATEWGPNFWNPMRKIGSVRCVVTREDFSRVAERNAGVAVFLRNVSLRYGDWTESKLRDSFIRTVPYKNALPEHNAGKWNKVIDDADIYAWRKEKAERDSKKVNQKS